MTSINLIGHPFAPIGMGEHVRCTYRALRRAAVQPRLVDVYGLNEPEPDSRAEFGPHLSREPADINVFHLNGDEIHQSLAHLEYHGAWTGYRIVYPAWELARYPKEWAEQLDRFDEIWAPSKFIADALRASCRKPVVHMPLGVEVQVPRFMSRRYFGLPEEGFCFLFFFDLRSYISRKNPQAVVDAFRRFRRRKPYAQAELVIKVHGAEHAPEAFEAFQAQVADLRDDIHLVTRLLTDGETKNLIRCCDSFVSLHRSEGFGRGIAEAMCLGKPVIATGYSGNMDFMTPETAHCVDYKLLPVQRGEYPHGEGQVWADPDIDQAAAYMVSLVEDAGFGRDLGRRARRHMDTRFAFRPTGIRYRERLRQLA